MNKVSIEYTFHCQQRTNIYRHGNHARGDMIYRLDATVRARRSPEFNNDLNIPKLGGKTSLSFISLSFFFLPLFSQKNKIFRQEPASCHSTHPSTMTFRARFKGILSLRHRDPNTALWRWIIEKHPSVLRSTLKNFFKNPKGKRSVTLIKSRSEHYCLSYLVIRSCHKKSLVVWEFVLKKKHKKYEKV